MHAKYAEYEARLQRGWDISLTEDLRRCCSERRGSHVSCCCSPFIVVDLPTPICFIAQLGAESHCFSVCRCRVTLLHRVMVAHEVIHKRIATSRFDLCCEDRD